MVGSNRYRGCCDRRDLGLLAFRPVDVVAILFLPILFGPAGIALGFVGNAKGDKPYGLWVGIGSIVTTIIGFILGALVYNASN